MSTIVREDTANSDTVLFSLSGEKANDDEQHGLHGSDGLDDGLDDGWNGFGFAFARRRAGARDYGSHQVFAVQIETGLALQAPLTLALNRPWAAQETWMNHLIIIVISTVAVHGDCDGHRP
jgi:hypothetical protein